MNLSRVHTLNHREPIFACIKKVALHKECHFYYYL